MGEKVIEALFEGWCDGEYELKKYEPDYDKVFSFIHDHADIDKETMRRIDSEITNLICSGERNAFFNGVYLCLELLNGNIFSQGRTGINE